MTRIVFRHASVFDGWNATLQQDRDVVVENGRIAAVEAYGVPIEGADVVECAGRVLMPGMIDAHTHIYIAMLDAHRLVATPATYVAHYATRFMRHALVCGFTTIRDVAAAISGAARALKDGLVMGPRLFFGGRALSQTGATVISDPLRRMAISIAAAADTAIWSR